MLRQAVQDTPGCDGILLGGHGLFTWGDTQKECYLSSIKTIDQMGEFVQEHARKSGQAPFGGAQAAAAPDRDALVAALLPSLRGAVSSNRRVIAHYDGGEDALTFANSKWAADLCRMGTSCPDHFLRTRISPLYLPWKPADGLDALKALIAERLVTYREDYGKYYKAHATPDSPALRDSNPSVVVVPGLGLFGFGKDKREARITSEFFVNAIHVMTGANALEDADAKPGPAPQARRAEQAGEFKSFRNYVALPRSEAFGIEYWALEEAKLQRMPPEREFSRRIVIVVGGGSGIGREVALLLAKRGAHVVVADLNAAGAEAVAGEAAALSSRELVLAVRARPDVAGEHCRRLPRHRGAVRRHRHRDQHRGDLPDAGARHAAGADLGPGDGHQRHEQPRPRRRGGEDPEGAGAAGGAGADELGQRGRAEVRQRGVRRQQGRDQPPDSRARGRPRAAGARQRHRAGHRGRGLGDVPARPRHRVAARSTDSSTTTTRPPRRCVPGSPTSTPAARLRGGRSCRRTAPTPSCSWPGTRAPRPRDTSSRWTAGCRRRSSGKPGRRRAPRRHADLALHHLLQRHAVSRHREGGGGGARAPRPRGRVPPRADLLRPDALQHRLRPRTRCR